MKAEWILFCMPLLAAVKVLLQGKLSKRYVRTSADAFRLNSRIFAALVLVTVAFFVRTLPTAATLGCSLLLGLCHAGYQVCYALAFQNGPVAPTTTLNQFNLVFPLGMGLLCYGERLSVASAFGLLLMSLAFFLLPSRQPGESRTNRLWLRYALLAAVAGGLGNCVMLAFAHIAEPAQKDPLVACAYAVAALLCGAVGRLNRGEGDALRPDWRIGLQALVIGAVLAGYNLMLLYGLSRISSMLLYPVVGAFSLIFIALGDLLLLKERLSRRQWGGIAAGMGAAVLLNL